MRRRTIYFAFALEAAAFVFLAGVLLDVAAHRRDEAFIVNQFGYRGPARAAKRPGERRVVIVGGTAAFGAGTAWPETLGPALVEAMNSAKGVSNAAPFADVQNISEPGAAAAEYVETLKAYAYLQPDVVAVYDGYDPVRREPAGRRDSFVFRSLGYLPMLSVRQRASADGDRSVAAQLSDETRLDGEPSCAGAFANYCAAMVSTVRFVLESGRSAMVVTPPYVSRRHELQQRSLAAALNRAFGGETRFRYVNIGPSIDLHDSTQSPDGVRTTPRANRTIARILAGPVVDLFER